MFNLMHGGDKIGSSRLERGDPDERTVSGVFLNIGGAKALSGWIKSIGGAEDQGVVYIAMDAEFELQKADQQPVKFSEGTLIAIPDDDEAYLEISFSDDESYASHFPEHIAALADATQPPE